MVVGGGIHAHSPTKDTNKNKKNKAGKKKSMSRAAASPEPSSWIQTVMMSAGSNSTLSENPPPPDNGVSVDRVVVGGERGLGGGCLGPVLKGPFVFPLVRPVSKI